MCTGVWKYARYFDQDNAMPNPDQFEFYHLPSDPAEAINLVDYKTGSLLDDVAVPGFTTPQLQAQLDQIKNQLAQQEAAVLFVYKSWNFWPTARNAPAKTSPTRWISPWRCFAITREPWKKPAF